MKKGDLFKGVIQWEMMTKDLSLEGNLPVFYYDNTAMTATYTASTDKVRKASALARYASGGSLAWPGPGCLYGFRIP